MSDMPPGSLESLLGRYGLALERVPHGVAIVGSYWGGEEAGIVGLKVFVREDTPVHSVLHEACHTICMTAQRRALLETDAGGDDLEESAACYLQILLADGLEHVGRRRLMQDMDAWGYSFRLGSAGRWFAEDAEDACNWLIDKGLVDKRGQPTYRLRA